MSRTLLYDAIGGGYAATRRTEPRIAAQLRCGILDIAGVTVGAGFRRDVRRHACVANALRLLHDGVNYSVTCAPSGLRAVPNTAPGAHPVGADYDVTAADLGLRCHGKVMKLAIWLREVGAWGTIGARVTTNRLSGGAPRVRLARVHAGNSVPRIRLGQLVSGGAGARLPGLDVIRDAESLPRSVACTRIGKASQHQDSRHREIFYAGLGRDLTS